MISARMRRVLARHTPRMRATVWVMSRRRPISTSRPPIPRRYEPSGFGSDEGKGCEKDQRRRKVLYISLALEK